MENSVQGQGAGWRGGWACRLEASDVASSEHDHLLALNALHKNLHVDTHVKPSLMLFIHRDHARKANTFNSAGKIVRLRTDIDVVADLEQKRKTSSLAFDGS